MDTGGDLARMFLKILYTIIKNIIFFTGLVIPLGLLIIDEVHDGIMNIHFTIYILSFILALYIFAKNLYHFFKFK